MCLPEGKVAVQTAMADSLASASLVKPIFAVTNPGIALVVAFALLAVASAMLVIVRKRLKKQSRVPNAAQSVTAPRKTGKLTVTIAGGTHVGGRENNEDAYLIKGNLVVLADGMGGQVSGELASGTLIGSFNKIDPNAPTWLSDGILGGNAEMRAMLAANPKLKDFGTTLVAARHDFKDMEVGSCGDSHFFRLRAGLLERLTEEHSLAQELVRRGQLSASEVPTHRFRNVLFRYVGASVTPPEWDTLKFPMQAGDIYLVCSDGLVDYSRLARVQQILESGKSAQEIAQDLLDMAVADKTKDNATAVVILVV